jgi:hypothetical protein
MVNILKNLRGRFMPKASGPAVITHPQRLNGDPDVVIMDLRREIQSAPYFAKILTEQLYHQSDMAHKSNRLHDLFCDLETFEEWFEDHMWGDDEAVLWWETSGPCTQITYYDPYEPTTYYKVTFSPHHNKPTIRIERTVAVWNGGI